MTNQLEIYYETDWKVNCKQNSSFLASWEGLSIYSHSMLVVFLPLYALTTFCILKKTPKSMNSVKWVLLNTHLWSCYVDILMCSLITPYFFFPTISGFPVGLFRFLGIPTSFQTFVGAISGMCMGISLVSLFENRSSCIPANKFRMTRKSSKLLYYSFFGILIFTYLIPLFMNMPDQKMAKLQVLHELSCPTKEFFYTDVFILTVDQFWKNYLWITTTVIVSGMFLQVIFFTSCCIYYLYISTEHVTSLRTRRLQRTFFISTVIQATVPFIFLAAPITSAILLISLKHYNQELNNCIILLMSLHGFFSTLAIITVHHPYRVFILQIVTFNWMETNCSNTGAPGANREGTLKRFPNRVQQFPF